MDYSEYLKQIREATDAGIKAGWDKAKVDWREIALQKLCECALTHKEFTANDFRDEIIRSGIDTHDRRAMGGLMKTARSLGWIRAAGKELPSLVGHGVPLQYWTSLIYEGPINTFRNFIERRKFEPVATQSTPDDKVFKVYGSHDKTYTVKLNVIHKWGQCTCESYRFSSKKTCKHIEQILKELRDKEIFEANKKQQTLL